MSLTGFYTTKGLALAAKLLAGTTLTITKVVAGDGETASSSEALASIKQTLTVGTATVKEQTATLPVTLAEVNSATSYSLSELGIYAEDPNEGEILYQVFRLDHVQFIEAGGKNTYRFYIQEMVGKGGIAVTCSPAGLLTDADIAPLRSKIMATNGASVSTNVAPEDLQSYLDSLPRYLPGSVYITVTGTISEAITVSDFFGPGYLHLIGTDLNQTFFTQGITVSNCALPVVIEKCTIKGGTNRILCYAAKWVFLQNCAVTGEGSGCGILADNHATVMMEGCSLKNNNVGVLAQRESMISVYSSDSSACSNNSTGAQVWRGGVVLLCGNTPNLLGGSANMHDGGLIVSANGSVI